MYSNKGSFYVRTMELASGHRVGYWTHSYYDKYKVSHPHSMGERATPLLSIKASTLRFTPNELSALKNARKTARQGSALEIVLGKVVALAESRLDA